MDELTAEPLLDMVRSACARVLEVDAASVLRAQSLADDLRADSLRTVGDIVDRARERL